MPSSKSKTESLGLLKYKAHKVIQNLTFMAIPLYPQNLISEFLSSYKITYFKSQFQVFIFSENKRW